MKCTLAIFFNCILIPLLYSCYSTSAISSNEGPDLNVKFYNKTGINIDSLVVGGTFVGFILNDSCSDYIKFSSFHFDSGIPRETIQAYLGERKIKTVIQSRCATEWSAKAKGTLEFVIFLQKYGNRDNLILAPM